VVLVQSYDNKIKIKSKEPIVYRTIIVVFGVW